MRISFLDAKTVGQVPGIDQLSRLGELSIYQTTKPEETVERIAESEIIITNKVLLTKEVLKHAPHLKLICIAATGTNNVDLDYCKQHGIAVKNAIDYSTKSVAQFTFNCLLYMLHQTHYYDHYVKSGGYAKSDIFTHIHHDFRELGSMKFGIVGLGNIGNEVAKLADAFGAKVFYYSTSGKNKKAVYPHLELNELLENCEVISIHCPLNENTKGLIGEEELNRMNSSAVLINMGRGGIVEELSLAKALKENKIRGAITDVLTEEPIKQDNPLLDNAIKDKILITPHIAWASLDARTKLMEIVVNHIKEYIENRS